MKNTHYHLAIPLTSVLLFGTAVSAEQDKITYLNSTNRVTLSLRFGLNIHTKFSGIGNSLGSGPALSGYYDDGYVVTASPPNTSPNPNYTTYWGYDSTSQLVGAAGAYTGVSFNHTTVTGASSDVSSAGDKPYPGFELSYDRELLEKENWHDLRFGFEAAVNWMNISLNNNSAIGGATLFTATDYYNFPITIPDPPPFADTGLPGQPALQVPPYNQTTATTPNATILTQDHFDADLWGGRLGPYAELPLTKKLDLRLSGGLAVGLLSGSDSWKQTLTPSGGSPITASGGGDAFDILWGYYASLDANWQINKRWAVDGGVQYQDLGKFDHNFGGRKVELDLSQSVFLKVGVSYSF
jgi:hypothetical protein